MAVWCAVLDVRRRGVYAYAQPQATPQIDRDEVALFARGTAMQAETGPRDGRRRMAKPRQEDGCAVGRAKARRVRQDAGVTVRRRTRRGPVTTASQHGEAVAPTLLARPFEVEKPPHVWAGDITSGWTAEGWLSVAVLLDWSARAEGGGLGAACPPRLRLGASSTPDGAGAPVSHDGAPAPCRSWESRGLSRRPTPAGDPGDSLSYESPGRMRGPCGSRAILWPFETRTHGSAPLCDPTGRESRRGR